MNQHGVGVMGTSNFNDLVGSGLRVLPCTMLARRFEKYGPVEIVPNPNHCVIRIEHGDVLVELAFEGGVLINSDWQIMKSPSSGGDSFRAFMKAMADRFGVGVFFHHHVGKGGTSEHAHMDGLTATRVEAIIAGMPYLFQ